MGLPVKHLIGIAALVPVMALAQDHCVLQQRTVSKTQAVITERDTIRRDIVPYFDGQRMCIVDFRVKINNQWHSAHGQYIWPGDRPAQEACAQAVKQAEDEVRQRVGRTLSTSENVLVCKDRPELVSISGSVVGSVGKISQFRPHPDRPERFWHEGTQCQMGVEPACVQGKSRSFQGVICQVKGDNWVVVDKY